MKNISKAIELAVKGGWKPKYVREYQVFYEPRTGQQSFELFGIFLDKNFWIALGKELGWVDSNQTYIQRPYTNWVVQWHSFIDSLAADKSPDSFFGDLIKLT